MVIHEFPAHFHEKHWNGHISHVTLPTQLNDLRKCRVSKTNNNNNISNNNNNDDD